MHILKVYINYCHYTLCHGPTASVALYFRYVHTKYDMALKVDINKLSVPLSNKELFLKDLFI